MGGRGGFGKDGTANDVHNFIGVNKHGKNVFRRLIDENIQIWVEVKDGIIQNGGINIPPMM
jgi:hypothetical protein